MNALSITIVVCDGLVTEVRVVPPDAPLPPITVRYFDSDGIHRDDVDGYENGEPYEEREL